MSLKMEVTMSEKIREKRIKKMKETMNENMNKKMNEKMNEKIKEKIHEKHPLQNNTTNKTHHTHHTHHTHRTHRTHRTHHSMTQYLLIFQLCFPSVWSCECWFPGVQRAQVLNVGGGSHREQHQLTPKSTNRTGN